MAELTPISPDRAANSFSWNAASAGGDSFPNTGNELLLVNHTNDAGSSVTLTVTTQKATLDGQSIGDLEITIAAGEQHLLGPWVEGWYNDADELVQLSYSSETDIELVVIDPNA